MFFDSDATHVEHRLGAVNPQLCLDPSPCGTMPVSRYAVEETPLPPTGVRKEFPGKGVRRNHRNAFLRGLRSKTLRNDRDSATVVDLSLAGNRRMPNAVRCRSSRRTASAK